ncbi:MAG: UDP-3-O-(3-hydroxymyristoyl)glucosamine N-acyltransferase [Armatimonadetes bacterium]|nr:UDP-3-O-(3-hydroxymyristoyl)glucosamine N-acyltransferase [Armatimonadota bacterium]
MNARSPLSVAALAERIDGTLHGDGTVAVREIVSPEAARPGAIVVCADAAAIAAARAGGAAAVVVRAEPPADLPAIVVSDTRLALAHLLDVLGPRATRPEGIHPTAVVEADVTLGAGVTIGAYAYVGAGARIGDRTIIHSLAYVGPNVAIGDDCEVHAHASLREGARLGARVIVQNGAVIGADGFGYVLRPQGHKKIPQVGAIVIEDDVEIGAATTIDRATLGETRIGAGTKIDNLVQIAHNVRIGRGCVIAAQCGIAGSTVVEDGVIFGGQVGVADHITVGHGAIALGGASIIGNVEPGQIVMGYPARPRREFLKAEAALRRLSQPLRQRRGEEAERP